MEEIKTPSLEGQGQLFAEDVFRHYGLPGEFSHSIAYGIWENNAKGLARIRYAPEALLHTDNSDFQVFAVFRDTQYPFALSLLVDGKERLADLAARAVFRDKRRF